MQFQRQQNVSQTTNKNLNKLKEAEILKIKHDMLNLQQQS